MKLLFNEKDIDELVVKMNEEQLSIEKAARLSFCSESTLNDALHRYGYWYTPAIHGWAKTDRIKLKIRNIERHPRKKRFTREQIEEMVAELNAGSTLKEVGRRRGCGLDAVYRYVRNEGYTFDAYRTGNRWRKEPKKK